MTHAAGRPRGDGVDRLAPSDTAPARHHAKASRAARARGLKTTRVHVQCVVRRVSTRATGPPTPYVNPDPSTMPRLSTTRVGRRPLHPASVAAGWRSAGRRSHGHGRGVIGRREGHADHSRLVAAGDGPSGDDPSASAVNSRRALHALPPPAILAGAEAAEGAEAVVEAVQGPARSPPPRGRAPVAGPRRWRCASPGCGRSRPPGELPACGPGTLP